MSLRGWFALGAAFTAGALLLRRAGLREDLEWEEADKPGKVEYIDGYGIHYLERGSGPAIVLVHGFGGHTYSYRELIPRFARDHRVIALDLKGFGYSERRADGGLSHTDQVFMLQRLLDRLGVARAVFVGHSMGGAVVHRFAATYPEMCDALVLAAPAVGRRFRGRPPAWIGVLIQPIMPLLARLASDRLFSTLYFDRPPNAEEIREEYMRPVRIRGSMKGLLAMVRDARADGEVDDRRITIPVLLLLGAHDPIVRLSSAPELRERFPSARLVVVERAAHGLLEERPDECERAIRDFLNERRASTPVGAAVSRD